MDICLANDWTRDGSTWVCTPHAPSNLAHTIETAREKELSRHFRQRRPPFSVVTCKDSTTHCVTDVPRSVPLYFAIADGQSHVADDATRICKQLSNVEYDPQSVSEFLTSGFVYEMSTLVDEIKQVPAGSVTSIDTETGEVMSTTYFEYEYGTSSDEGTTSFEGIKQGLQIAFEDLIADANGRQLVVPLSGGYDSRLLLLSLVQLGYDNILTYSHGREGNSEMTTARTVAEQVGVEWLPITYTNDDWRSLRDDELFREYWEAAFNYDRLPGVVHMNWMAVRRLIETRRVDDDCIFLPGHTAVMMGEHLPETYLSKSRVTRERIVSDLYRRSGSWLWSEIDESIESSVRAAIRNDLGSREEYDIAEAVTAYERWDWAERGAKWIHADLDIYRFFDVDYRLPFWHPAFVSAWSSVPLEDRYDKRVLREYTDQLYAELAADHDSIGTASDSLLRRAFYAVRDSPLRRLFRPLNAYLRYRKDPSAWPGIIPESTFRAIYTGHENRHTFFALSALGLVDFDTGYVSDAVRGGQLSSDVITEAVARCEQEI
jgi:asparagine synthase (glutamine-hydrolysing)